MDISENSALFVYPEARRSGNAPGRPRRQTGRRRASAGSYRHGGLKLKYSGIGGQAVLEGIMMKNKDTYATAVRKPDGEIVIQKDTYVSMTEKVKFFSLPFVRGIFSFADSMILGMKTLTWSASFFEDDEEDEAPGRFESFLIDKFGEKTGSAYICIVGILAFICFVLAKNRIFLYGIILFWGLGSGITSVLPTLLTSKIFGNRDYGPIYGIVLSVNRFGGVIGTVLVSLLFDLTGDYTIIWPACVASMVLALAAIMICLNRSGKASASSAE